MSTTKTKLLKQHKKGMGFWHWLLTLALAGLLVIAVLLQAGVVKV